MTEPRGWTAFVGSYGSPEEQGIHIVRDDGSQVLRNDGGARGIANPSFLAVHPSRRVLYSVSEVGVQTDGAHGSVHALEMVETDAGFHFVSRGAHSTKGDHPCHVSLDPSGRWMVVANYGSGDIAVFRLQDDGRIAECTDRVRHAGRGPDSSRQSSPHPHSATFSPCGKYVIVADLGTDELVVYGLDDGRGELVRCGEHRCQPGAGPRLVTFHPGGMLLGTVNELSNSVTLFEWHADAAELHEVHSVATLPAGVDVPNLAAGMTFSPSGGHLYVSNRGHDSVTAYVVHPSGELRILGARSSGGRWPRAIAVTPDGDGLLAANERSDTVVFLPLVAGGFDERSPASMIDVAAPSAIAFP